MRSVHTFVITIFTPDLPRLMDLSAANKPTEKIVVDFVGAKTAIETGKRDIWCQNKVQQMH